MATLQPIYTRENCSFCAPLRWGLTVFWRAPVTATDWLADLTRAIEADGIRILGHRLSEPHVSQFSLSTLPHRERWAEIREPVLERLRHMSQNVCRAKGYSLSRAGILTNHIHLALSSPHEVAPADVALAFLNNLAYVHGMKAVFQFGAYIGTFGEYHQGAVESDETPSAEG